MPYADMDKILSLSKRRGFVFQSSEIYGGLGSTWDYGPLGVELKRNVKEAWWQAVVYDRAVSYTHLTLPTSDLV